MIGSFITRGIIMGLGYVYPTYECYKIVERNKPDLEHLKFWCQYWMIIAILTVLERLGDVLVSWVPMYSEAKLAFVIYLWYPKTMGTKYIYDFALRPFIARHEQEIDQNLNELKTRSGDIALQWWQRGSLYVQTRFLQLLQFLASQSDRDRKVFVSKQGLPITPMQSPTQRLPQGCPQGGFFDPPQSQPIITNVGINFDSHSGQCDDAFQRTNLCQHSKSSILSKGESEVDYNHKHVEQFNVELDLSPQVSNSKIHTDNPWFILARVKLLLFCASIMKPIQDHD